MRRWHKVAIGTALGLGILLSAGITATIGWAPFFGPKVRPLTDRRIEPSAARLERGEYLVRGVAGCLFWWPVAQDEPHALDDGGRALYVFAAFLLASPLGLLLALIPSPVYDYYEQGGSLWGLSVLTDQQIAGVTMAAEQAIVFFAVFTYFLSRFLAAQEAET